MGSMGFLFSKKSADLPCEKLFFRFWRNGSSVRFETSQMSSLRSKTSDSRPSDLEVAGVYIKNSIFSGLKQTHDFLSQQRYQHATEVQNFVLRIFLGLRICRSLPSESLHKTFLNFSGELPVK